MRQSNIIPIFVFDGKPPASKADVLEQRRGQRDQAHKEIEALESLDISGMSQMDKAITEKKIADLTARNPTVTGSDKDLIKQLLYGAGVLFVSASGEADDLLGLLARSGIVKAVVSTDMDMLARGVPILIVPETPDTSVLTEIKTITILSTLGLTYPQFVDACILMGTDYTGSSFRTRPPIDAITAVKRGDPFKGMDQELITSAAASLRGDSASFETLMNPIQLAKFMGGAPQREPETLTKMAAEYGWPASWIC
jgi:flap endonuclease-1